jgi:hypothetical protein
LLGVSNVRFNDSTTLTEDGTNLMYNSTNLVLNPATTDIDANNHNLINVDRIIINDSQVENNQTQIVTFSNGIASINSSDTRDVKLYLYTNETAGRPVRLDLQGNNLTGIGGLVFEQGAGESLTVDTGDNLLYGENKVLTAANYEYYTGNITADVQYNNHNLLGAADINCEHVQSSDGSNVIDLTGSSEIGVNQDLNLNSHNITNGGEINCTVLQNTTTNNMIDLAGPGEITVNQNFNMNSKTIIGITGAQFSNNKMLAPDSGDNLQYDNDTLLSSANYSTYVSNVQANITMNSYNLVNANFLYCHAVKNQAGTNVMNFMTVGEIGINQNLDVANNNITSVNRLYCNAIVHSSTNTNTLDLSGETATLNNADIITADNVGNYAFLPTAIVDLNMNGQDIQNIGNLSTGIVSIINAPGSIQYNNSQLQYNGNQLIDSSNITNYVQNAFNTVIAPWPSGRTILTIPFTFPAPQGYAFGYFDGTVIIGTSNIGDYNIESYTYQISKISFGYTICNGQAFILSNTDSVQSIAGTFLTDITVTTSTGIINLNFIASWAVTTPTQQVTIKYLLQDYQTNGVKINFWHSIHGRRDNNIIDHCLSRNISNYC